MSKCSLRVVYAFVCVLACVLSSACSDDDQANLIVLLKTDLVSGVEFARVTVELYPDPGLSGAEPVLETRRTIDAGRTLHFATGSQVASFDLAKNRELFVLVRLLDSEGDTVAARPTRVTFLGDMALQVLITRNCAGIDCTTSGSSSLAEACLDGRCVDSHCSPEHPELCPAPACTNGTSGCTTTATCATAQCEEGVCFYVESTSTMCSGTEYCDPFAGCMQPPISMDASIDGGVDAGIDSGVGDAGLDTGVDAGRRDPTIEPSGVPGFLITLLTEDFGRALALSADGTTIAIGAPGNPSAARGIGPEMHDTDAHQSGAVYVYRRVVDDWVLEAFIKASNAESDDTFGIAVALSADGNDLVVGAYGEYGGSPGINGDELDNSRAAAGAAYVFQRVGSTWSQIAYVKPNVVAEIDQFGLSVTMSDDGSRFAVGAPREYSSATGINGVDDNDFMGGTGAVYVFERVGSTWSQTDYIRASDSDGADFGSAVAFNDDATTLAVGAFGEAATGLVYVFRRTAGVWSEEARITAAHPSELDYFGDQVELSDDGNRLLVGAEYEDGEGRGLGGDESTDGSYDSGAAFLFHRTGSTWTQELYIKASNADPRDVFGSALAMSGDGLALLIGAEEESSRALGINGDEHDNGAGSSGAAYLFRFDGVWAQTDFIKSPVPHDGELFGYGVAFSSDGNHIAIAAPAARDRGVYAYDRIGE